MNYRHHYHAGNFADLIKHALLLALISELKAQGAPLNVIDTHAGAGLYDLEGEEAAKSGEAAAGILRLMADPDAPPAFAPLIAQVKALNRNGPVRLYPGSPALCMGALGAGDRYLGCELRPDDSRALGETLRKLRRKDGPDGIANMTDGYETVQALRPDSSRRLLVLIDPPFERGDDYDNLVETARKLLRLRPRPLVAIWAPIKDLETFDSLLRRLEEFADGRGLVVQARLRPLINPMKMNGTAMILLGDTTCAPMAKAICDWVATHLGEKGALARVEPLSPAA